MDVSSQKPAPKWSLDDISHWIRSKVAERSPTSTPEAMPASTPCECPVPGAPESYPIERVLRFSEGLAPALSGGLWGYIDEARSWLIPPTFESALSFREGVAEVKLDGEWRKILHSDYVPAQTDTEPADQQTARCA